MTDCHHVPVMSSNGTSCFTCKYCQEPLLVIPAESLRAALAALEACCEVGDLPMAVLSQVNEARAALGGE